MMKLIANQAAKRLLSFSAGKKGRFSGSALRENDARAAFLLPHREQRLFYFSPSGSDQSGGSLFIEEVAQPSVASVAVIARKSSTID
ncbi:hypothetical protein [Bradyrhizobium sp. SZCCHNRI3043]|uniref:hypothetical protein n=1 Tax=Bradyrhizobium sp. SZCCHNRI3043 TaxID=3057292 RepID=UPI0028E641DE|nr:hypothetical protein [Bradyrhizobium sp. SZCCHNRI3043]